MKTKLAFNAKTQTTEEAVVTIDVNGEYLFTFADGSFFKLPGDFKKADIDDFLAKHEEQNKGQVSAEEAQKINEAKLKNV